MWVYQCLDILSTVVEMACLYIISGILLKESRFHTSLCKYIPPIIMFMVTWILTWFSGLGAFKMPIIFIVAFTVLQVSYKESIYQTVIAIEIWFICCIFLVEAFVYPVSKFIFNNMLLVVIDGQNILRWEVYVIAIAIQYITSYARADSITRKSPSELRILREAGLNHIYSGIETGSDQILKLINKGFNADTAVKSGCMAKEADMILSEFILLGIGGKELSEENATRTAEALNVIRPDFIRVHATGIKPESKMGEFVREGSFTLQSEEEIMIEQKRFLQQLKEMDSYYVNEHIINLLLEVRGNLRTDKEKMLSDINRFLNLPANEKLLFVIGRRFNIFFMLDDLNNQELHKKAEGALQKILNKNPEVDFTVLCNYIRQSQI